ncbi:hypothetical protein [Bradyrhizobium sp. AZCC 2230]|uniref:hypothetical protein n=1 Tax=Bradyrhizobium sp. AZCC 2230 TaxID=3117021 RepID=UPI002FF217F3
MGLIHARPDSIAAAAAAAPLLQVSNISMRFGSVNALDGISLNFARGQIAGLIGPLPTGLGYPDDTSAESCLSLKLEEGTGDLLVHGLTGDVNASQQPCLLCAIS